MAWRRKARLLFLINCTQFFVGLTASLAQSGTDQGAKQSSAQSAASLPLITVNGLKRRQAKLTAAKRKEAVQGQAVGAEAVSPNGPPITSGPPTITTSAGPVSGYHAFTAVSANKTSTPIEQIPQTIDVLPRAVIDDQKPLTQDELFHNISDVSGMAADYSPYGISYKVRGFLAERYVDGLPNYNDGGDYSSTVNTERIEVIKGPGGLFYQGGLGVIGGVIDTISKLPGATPAYHAGVNFGSFALYNPWFDVNQPLNDSGTALFRLTGEFAHSRDYVDVIENDRFSLNPTFTFDNHDGSVLTVQGSVSQRQSQTYAGLPAIGTLETSAFSIRPTLFFGDQDIPKSPSDYAGATVRFDHEINDVWSFNVATRYESSQLKNQSQAFFVNTPAVPPSTFTDFNFHLLDGNDDFSIAPNLIGKFNLGPTQNTLLLGADYDRVHATVFAWEGLAGLIDLSNPNPVFPAYSDPAITGFSAEGFLEHVTNSGAIVQWQSTIFDRLHISAGLREAYVDVQNTNFVAGTGPSYDSKETKLLPKIGAAYDLLHGVTAFVGYGEGLRGERLFTGPVVPKPEQTVQVESGLKLSLPAGFAATVSAFDITYRNVATGDPTTPLQELQVGEERSKGFDADITWQPIPGLSILANYAYVDARIVQDGNVFPAGNFVDFVPQNSGRLWANYKFLSGSLKNLVIGAGVYSATRQTLDLTDQFWTPGYTILDAKIAYETKDWTIALVAKNLTDRHYFVPYSYFALATVAPGTPLTLLASLSFKN
jgi:iron complex outermembrane receptor protein